MAKSIMIQGTASNAGKSLLCAGLCRIFAQDGYKVAPFKSQNMALNSAITKEGLEMGRAQVVQAQAAGVEPTADMNPILLKPTSNVGSQVIVRGVPRGTMGAVDYYKYKSQLIPDIMESYRRLDEEYDIIVIEGAGSPAEINLKEDDFVNMGMAKLADAPVLLCGDIDRGGVFASLYGTVKLLEEDEQARIKGLLINKFRGDVEILRPGLTMLEELTDKPVLGVVPMLDVDVDDEDSLSTRLEGKKKVGLIDIAVVRLPRLSNFTDFNPLERMEQVNLRYVRDPRELGNPDLIILPGTKTLWTTSAGSVRAAWRPKSSATQKKAARWLASAAATRCWGPLFPTQTAWRAAAPCGDWAFCRETRCFSGKRPGPRWREPSSGAKGSSPPWREWPSPAMRSIWERRRSPALPF